MEWDRNIGLIIINILILSICILMFKKRAVLGFYKYYMIAAMLLTYFIDVVNFYIRLHKNIPNEFMLYFYIYGGMGIFFLLLFLMYQSLIKDKLLNKLTKIIMFFFIVFFLFQIFSLKISIQLLQNLLYFNVFLLLFSITLFMLDTFKTDVILEINKYYPFWFSLGIIVIYIGIIPSAIVSGMKIEKLTVGLWSFITFVINLIGYSLLFIGLLKAKKIEK